jgi:maltodextrin utilization protein YvdJ
LIFPNLWAEQQEEEAESRANPTNTKHDKHNLKGSFRKQDDTRKKRYKISYQMNILTMMTESDDKGLSLMHVLANSNELEIFETDLVKDVIDYKWYTYAIYIHTLAAIVHASYVFVLIFYIKHYYLDQSG